MNWKVVLFLIFISQVGQPAWAGERILLETSYLESNHCQNLLSNVDEFERIPNDFRQGLITREVPMNVETLKVAYRNGIFPWGELPNGQVEWYSPPKRGVLELSQIHIPRSDRKMIERMLRSGEYQVTFDRDFEGVIRGCAEAIRWTRDHTSGERRMAGQWISAGFIENYIRLHREGIARSVEVWKGGRLVGGLYGVFMDGVYSGESMFHIEDNAGKLAFYVLLGRLKDEGHQFIDTQQARPGVGLASKWGAREVSRFEFLQLLHQAQALNLSY